ncbi:MAG: hypothetical protein Q9217_004875, partial [Psora testacea]
DFQESLANNLRDMEDDQYLDPSAFQVLPIAAEGKIYIIPDNLRLMQLDVLADYDTKSYLVGSTNLLLLQQKDRYSDILINVRLHPNPRIPIERLYKYQLDESTINITSSALRIALSLSAADRRWIDFLNQTVTDSWDESNPSRPKTMGYMGSEEFIRLQFEEYLLALLSAAKYHLYLQHSGNSPVEASPIVDFNSDWMSAWQQTSSFALFNKTTDSHVFDIVEPRHPTAGNMTIEDVQRRLTQQIQTLHLDERLATSKEALNKHLATGQKKVSTAFAHLWADIEAMREAQRKRQAEYQASMEGDGRSLSRAPSEASTASAVKGLAVRAPDFSSAQASVQAAGQKAGAYLSSWGLWASERRKGWTSQGSEESNESASAEGRPSKSPSRSKLQRWNSVASLGKTAKEQKGPDGIGRLDA